MEPWSRRAREEAFLLNPAFSAIIVSSAITGYEDSGKEGVPFPLVFMFLPITLHGPTREILPRTSRTPMISWLNDHPTARVQFPERVISLKPYTREALQFGLAHDWFFFNDKGSITTTKREREMNNALRTFDGDVRECALKAKTLGKWFALSGTPETVMSLWGIVL